MNIEETFFKNLKSNVDFNFNYKLLEIGELDYSDDHPDPNCKNSTLYSYFQTGKDQDDFDAYARNHMLFTFLKHPCFNTLRTKEQLGYIVHCVSNFHGGKIGGYILVHSSNKGPIYL